MFDFLMTVLVAAFIALMIAGMLTFGIILLGWFIGLGLVLSIAVLIRSWIRRWLFLRNSEPDNEGPPIIEVEYKDITPK